jgi:hypothetical protein
MKRLLLLTILVALLVSLVDMPIASGDNGLHKGYSIGEGHYCEHCGKGHDKHGCNPSCPLCGGYPCIPPCPNA